MNADRYSYAIRYLDSLDKRFKGNKKVGWVYVFMNPSYKPLMYKVGETGRPPHLRLEELSRATAVPTAYQLVYFVHVDDRRRAEKYVHNSLSQYRHTSNKEFFIAPLGKLLSALDSAAKSFPVLDRNTLAPLEQAFSEQVVKCLRCHEPNRIKGLAIRVRLRCSNCQSPISAR